MKPINLPLTTLLAALEENPSLTFYDGPMVCNSCVVAKFLQAASKDPYASVGCGYATVHRENFEILPPLSLAIEAWDKEYATSKQQPMTAVTALAIGKSVLGTQPKGV